MCLIRLVLLEHDFLVRGRDVGAVTASKKPQRCFHGVLNRAKLPVACSTPVCNCPPIRLSGEELPMEAPATLRCPKGLQGSFWSISFRKFPTQATVWLSETKFAVTHTTHAFWTDTEKSPWLLGESSIDANHKLNKV